MKKIRNPRAPLFQQQKQTETNLFLLTDAVIREMNTMVRLTDGIMRLEHLGTRMQRLDLVREIAELQLSYLSMPWWKRLFAEDPTPRMFMLIVEWLVGERREK